MRRAIDEHGRVDVLVNNVGARAPPDRTASSGPQRRRVRVGAAAELLHRAARDPRRGPGHAHAAARGRSSTSPRSTRSSSPTPARDRLRRGQGGAAEPQQVARRRSSGRRGSTSTASRRARSRTDLWLGDARRRGDRRQRPTGVDADTAASRRAHRRLRDRPLHHAGGGRDARRAARLRRAPRTSPAPTTSSTAG